MKKSILQFSVIAAIAATMTLFTSCSSDESLNGQESPKPVNFGVSLGRMGVTRAGTPEAVQAMTSIDGILKENVLIGIYTKDADGLQYQKVYKVTADGTTNTATDIAPNDATTFGKFYWKNTTETKIIEAFSYGETTGALTTPNISKTALASAFTAGTDLADFGKFTVETDQSTAASTSNKELLYWYGRAAYTDYGSGTAINIPLNHQLARINVEITTPKQASELTSTMTLNIGKAVTTNFTTDEITEATSDTEAHAYNKSTSDTWDRGVVIAGTFTKPTGFNATYKAGTSSDVSATDKFGTWTASTDAADINKSIKPRVTVAETTISGTPDTYKTTYSAVVIPQNFQNTYMFVINYDGAEYVYIGKKTDTIESGKEYTYSITISASELDVTQATIQDWSNTNRNATAVLQ